MGEAENNLFVGVVPFVAAAETRSFRKAAARLGLTPSAVSKAISRLEQDVGARLLNRSARSVTLTDEGESFLRSCRDAVSNVRAARERLSAVARVPRGTLRVSLPLLLGRKVVLPALESLLDRHPQLTIQAGLTDRFVQLTDENIDLAVRIGALPDSGLTMRKLSDVRWLTVASPAYLARHGRPTEPEQLRHHNCLRFMLPRGVAQEWQFTARAAPDDTSRDPRRAKSPARPLAIRGTLCTDDGAALIDAAGAGFGIFQAHDYAVARQIERGELVEVLPEFAAPGPPITLLLAPGKRGTPRVKIVADHLTELFRS